MSDLSVDPPADGPAVDPAHDPALGPGGLPRKVLFVAGAGRSGTSTMTGLMQILGLHVPQPEVVADESNPKGFGEPQWVVDHHDRLLKEAGVQVSDARPDAWFEAGRVSIREEERIRTADWLEGHFAEGHELVVKDPRLSWFLSLWRKYYANRLGSAHLTASWLNMLLHTERATRESVADGGRAFVRYADLLDDWTRTTMQMGETLGLQHVLHARSEAIRDGHRFVDPGLRRVSQGLEDLHLPRRLHELTAETWQELDRLGDPGADTPEAHRTLDQLREAYVDLYEESEAISRSSAVAAEQRTRKALKQGPHAPPGAAPRPGSLVDRVPHDLRAKIPPSVRRGLRRALGRQR